MTNDRSSKLNETRAHKNRKNVYDLDAIRKN